MLIGDPNWFEKRAAEVRQRALDRRRHRSGRRVIAQFSGVDAAPRERLAPGQFADLGAAAPVNLPSAIPIERAADAARVEFERAALHQQRAAADLRHTGHTGMVDFRGIDSD